MLVQPPLRIPNIPRLLFLPRGQIHRDPSNLQLHAWRVSGMPSAAEAFRSTFVSCVSRPQRESTLAIYEFKWRIFTDWCNIQHINPLSASENVVSEFLLHLHTEKYLAISTIAGYQMSITSTLRATSSAEVGRNPALKSLLRNIEIEQGQHQTSFSRVKSYLNFFSIDKTTFRTARPSIRSAANMEDSFSHSA